MPIYGRRRASRRGAELDVTNSSASTRPSVSQVEIPWKAPVRVGIYLRLLGVESPSHGIVVQSLQRSPVKPCKGHFSQVCAQRDPGVSCSRHLQEFNIRFGSKPVSGDCQSGVCFAPDRALPAEAPRGCSGPKAACKTPPLLADLRPSRTFLEVQCDIESRRSE
jgi:hypothetical protein